MQFLKECLVVVGLILIVIAIVAGGILPISRATCLSRWRFSGYNYQWDVWGGCRIEIDPGRWLPEEQLKHVEVRNGR